MTQASGILESAAATTAWWLHDDGNEQRVMAVTRSSVYSLAVYFFA